MKNKPSSLVLTDTVIADFKGEILQILKSVAPAEISAFELYGSNVISELSKTHVTTTQSFNRPTFEFGPVLEMSLVTLHLVAGTLALIDVIHRIRSFADERRLKDKIETEWLDFLIRQGMPEDLARHVPVKYSYSLAAFLARHRIVTLDQ